MTHVQKETAILLKEKGFDVPCEVYYTTDCYGKEFGKNIDYNKLPINSGILCSCPELYKVPIWLRTKGVHVVALPVNLWQQWRMFIYIDTYPPQKTRIPDKPMDFQTHDLALESGIVHALKHYVK